MERALKHHHGCVMHSQIHASWPVAPRRQINLKKSSSEIVYDIQPEDDFRV